MGVDIVDRFKVEGKRVIVKDLRGKTSIGGGKER